MDCGLFRFLTGHYRSLPEREVDIYEDQLQEYVNREYLYLLLDKNTYGDYKCDVNLLDVYEQEIRVREAMMVLIHHKISHTTDNQIFKDQFQILEKDISRFHYLADELKTRLRKPSS